METNEQGLTKEEKVMFSILGIILIIAVGVLIINSISSNDRKLEEDNKTPITETQGQEDTIKDEVVTDNSDSNLIEDTTEESEVVVNNQPIESDEPSNQLNNVVSSPETTPEVEQLPNNSEIKEEEKNEGNENLPEEGTGSTQPDIIISWKIKDTVITSAYANEEIIIDKNVLLEDGTEAEAAVTVRKQEGDTLNIIDISEGKFTVSAGLYKYYYTYNDVTQEFDLIVSNYLEHENLTFLTLKDEYVPESNITEEDFNTIKENLTNVTLTKEENIYNITSKIELSTFTLLPLVVSFNEELSTTNITSKTLGVTTRLNNELWHEEITTQDLIIILDLTQMNVEDNKIIINIDGIDYELLLNIVEQIPSESEQEQQKEDNNTCEINEECNKDEKTESNEEQEYDEEKESSNLQLEEEQEENEELTENNENIENQIINIDKTETDQNNNNILDGENSSTLSP